MFQFWGFFLNFSGTFPDFRASIFKIRAAMRIEHTLFKKFLAYKIYNKIILSNYLLIDVRFHSGIHWGLSCVSLKCSDLIRTLENLFWREKVSSILIGRPPKRALIGYPREKAKNIRNLPRLFLERNKITGQMGLEKMIADFSLIAAKSERVGISRVRRKNQSREKTHETPSRSTFTIDLLSPNLKYHWIFILHNFWYR